MNCPEAPNFGIEGCLMLHNRKYAANRGFQRAVGVQSPEGDADDTQIALRIITTASTSRGPCRFGSCLFA